jgi:hypothetical protein
MRPTPGTWSSKLRRGTIAQSRDAALASLLGGAVVNQSLTNTLSGALQDLVSYVQNGNTFVPSR